MLEPEFRIPLTEITHAELLARRGVLKGWVYPKRSISSLLPTFPTAQQNAVGLWGWVAILFVLAGLVVPFVLQNWWWALLVVAGFVVWRGNRESLGQFFCENLVADEKFFDRIRSSQIGPHVLAVFRG